jgi:hypothetical protein
MIDEFRTVDSDEVSHGRRQRGLPDISKSRRISEAEAFRHPGNREKGQEDHGQGLFQPQRVDTHL